MVSRIVEELVKEEKFDAAKRMLADGILSIEKIAEYLGLTVDEVRGLNKRKALCNLLCKLNEAESSIQEEGTISADKLEEELDV